MPAPPSPAPTLAGPAPDHEKAPSSTTPTPAAASDAAAVPHVVLTTEFGVLPIPRRLRYDPATPFHFGLLMNASFGFASTFIVANLYYCQPLLIQFSESFGVSYDEVSRIPTLVQAGYAAGLLLISPLGDLVRRRQLVLVLVLLSASLSIGLAVTTSLVAFEVLTFLVGAVTVTPQILLPLAADLAPPARRARAISVVLTGLLFGILLARVLAGVIAQFASWRVVYYVAVGVQAAVLLGAWAVIPDYPAKNRELTYGRILWTMARYAVTEPVLVQACLINIASSACFSSFWVTLTFLLGEAPYNYSTLVIGLFGLVGMFGVAMGPLVGRTVDALVPWYATLLALLALVAFQGVQLGAGGVSIAAVVVACVGLDVFRQTVQISLATSIFGISAAARARLNAVFVLSLFVGQVMGTAVGTRVFVAHGWRAAAGVSLAWYGWQLAVLLARGPRCARETWFGYEGGWRARKDTEALVGDGEQGGAVERAGGEGEGKSGGDEKQPVRLGAGDKTASAV